MTKEQIIKKMEELEEKEIKSETLTQRFQINREYKSLDKKLRKLN